tara:strand:- start:3463 stop:3699 length:237 start_codon:yes stop_codon:yes gene_type:complete
VPKALREFTDEELAQVGGQPGSMEDYRHTMEFRRRELTVHRAVAEAQIKAANWTRWSAVAVAVSVVVTAAGVWIDWVQ